MRHPFWWLALLVFPLCYTAIYEALSWYSVYVLDWWDPQFGDRQGGIAFGHDLLTLFVGVASFSYALGLALSWRRASALSSARMALLGASAASVSQVVAFLFSLGIRSIGPDAGMMLTLAGLAIVLLGPGAFTIAAVLLATRSLLS